MPLTINGAGSTAADPMLAGLVGRLTFAASTMDVSTVDDAWLDQTSGFPGTNTVKSSLSPAATVLLAGTTASYNDTSDQLTVSSTTGLSANDAIYLSHAGITAGIYIIGSVVNGTTLTLRNDPFAGGGNKTNISFQVAWSYQLTLGNAPSATSAAGQINYFKARVSDSAPSQSQLEDLFYVRNAPSGTGYINIGGVAFTGGTVNTSALSLNILNGWTNNGGIATVSLANHSVQSVNNFTWTSGGGTAERTVSLAESSGLTASAGDGIKYGRLIFRSFQASSNQLGVDIQVTVDTAGPSLVLSAFGV